jgi:prepilin-type N-terminal cleavage/methylation domain-containing protein
MRTPSTTADTPTGTSDRAARRLRPRRGLTLVEILVAMTVTSVLIAATVPFFVAQARAVGTTAARTDAHQNARYAVNTIDRDLRVAGVGVVDAQPMVVWAASNAMTVNGDLVSLSRDASAVYSDPDAALGSVISLGKASQVGLPLSSPAILYPDTTYWLSSTLTSAAETASYWLAKDSSSTQADVHILWRRVNDTPPRIVAKNLVVQAGHPAFRYFKADSLGRMLEIDQTTLPLYHSAPIHSRMTGTTRPDTGKSALTDSIRAVSVRLVGRYFDKRQNREILDTAEVFVRIPNAGLHRVATCGEPPLFSATVTAVWKPLDTGEPAIELSWTPATDETGGEVDVERYAVYRRRATDLLFAEPLAILPAGTSTYSYVDNDIASGDEFVYGVAAQDCTPKSSSMSTTAAIAVP